MITEAGQSSYPATIIGFLNRTAEELEAVAPPNSGDQLPIKSNLLLLKTAEGTKVVPFERIQDVKFLGKYNTTLATDEFRNLLSMKLDWAGLPKGRTADVGMVYLQKGIRWIPEYKIELDGKGKALVKLQATLLNELTDMEDVTVNLVVGVPTFMFKETVDPIALGQTMAGLSPYFDQGSQTAYAFSNSMMTQTARMGEYRRQDPPGTPPPAQPAELGPEIAGAGKNEDLFIYTVKHIGIKKGQRMVLPVAQSTLEYKDVFVMDIPVTPPPEVRQHFSTTQQAELAKLFHAPKVLHRVRLFNKSNQPLTTAPALIVRDHRILAQGMMTYTAAGATTDLDVTTAVDIQVKKTDKETKRTPNTTVWQKISLGRIDLTGTIDLRSYRAQPVEIEIVRHVLGNVGEVDHGGQANMENLFEDDGYTKVYSYPYWWHWYAWGPWWHHFNGIGRITWNVKLEPGQSVDLGYAWYYYWN